MKLFVLSPSEAVAEALVDSVTLPSVDGPLTALQGHDTLLALLEEGMVRCSLAGARGKREVREFRTGPGLAEVIHDMVTVCAASAVEVETGEGRKEGQKGGKFEGRTL
ncbi:MAG: hypothetical protein JXA24_01170 [Proteobacteria bacterium]|nr:hypothetical protein [Pseudomonadota bacterium]